MIRIAIVDDQEIVRESLKILLSTQKDFQVVGLGKDGYDALRLIDRFRPDVLLLDIRMPIMDGVEASQTLKARSPSTAIIILTTFEDDEYVLKAVRNGASGYLLKSLGMDELEQAIRTVNAGGSLMTPKIATKAFRLFSKMAVEQENPENCCPSTATRSADDYLSVLSHTELTIMSLIGRGLANKEVATELSLSEGTVRNYISSILRKLRLRDRTQIAIFAVRKGLTGSAYA